MGTEEAKEWRARHRSSIFILALMRLYRSVSPKIKLYQTRFPIGTGAEGVSPPGDQPSHTSRRGKYQTRHCRCGKYLHSTAARRGPPRKSALPQ